jgi:hypothetical protein
MNIFEILKQCTEPTKRYIIRRRGWSPTIFVNVRNGLFTHYHDDRQFCLNAADVLGNDWFFPTTNMCSPKFWTDGTLVYNEGKTYLAYEGKLYPNTPIDSCEKIQLGVNG